MNKSIVVAIDCLQKGFQEKTTLKASYPVPGKKRDGSFSPREMKYQELGSYGFVEAKQETIKNIKDIFQKKESIVTTLHYHDNISLAGTGRQSYNVALPSTSGYLLSCLPELAKWDIGAHGCKREDRRDTLLKEVEAKEKEYALGASISSLKARVGYALIQEIAQRIAGGKIYLTPDNLLFEIQQKIKDGELPLVENVWPMHEKNHKYSNRRHNFEWVHPIIGYRSPAKKFYGGIAYELGNIQRDMLNEDYVYYPGWYNPHPEFSSDFLIQKKIDIPDMTRPMGFKYYKQSTAEKMAEMFLGGKNKMVFLKNNFQLPPIVLNMLKYLQRYANYQIYLIGSMISYQRGLKFAHENSESLLSGQLMKGVSMFDAVEHGMKGGYCVGETIKAMKEYKIRFCVVADAIIANDSRDIVELKKNTNFINTKDLLEKLS